MASVQGTYPDQTWGQGLPGYFKDAVKPFVAQEAFQIPRENVAIPNIITTSTVGAVNKRGFIDQKVTRFQTIRNYIENKKAYISRISVPDPLAGTGGIENIRYFARIQPLPFADLEDYEDIKFWARYLHDNGKDPLTFGYAVNVFDAALNDQKAARMRDAYKEKMRYKLNGIDPTTIERKTMVEVRQQVAQQVVDEEEKSNEMDDQDTNMESSNQQQEEDGGAPNGGNTQPGILNSGTAPSAPGGGGGVRMSTALAGTIGGIAAAGLLAGGYALGTYQSDKSSNTNMATRTDQDQLVTNYIEGVNQSHNSNAASPYSNTIFAATIPPNVPIPKQQEIPRTPLGASKASTVVGAYNASQLTSPSPMNTTASPSSIASAFNDISGTTRLDRATPNVTGAPTNNDTTLMEYDRLWGSTATVTTNGAGGGGGAASQSALLAQTDPNYARVNNYGSRSPYDSDSPFSVSKLGVSTPKPVPQPQPPSSQSPQTPSIPSPFRTLSVQNAYENVVSHYNKLFGGDAANTQQIPQQPDGNLLW